MAKTTKPKKAAQPTPETPATEPPPAPEPDRPVKDRRLCRIEACDRVAVAGGLCGAHYASRRGG